MVSDRIDTGAAIDDFHLLRFLRPTDAFRSQFLRLQPSQFVELKLDFVPFFPVIRPFVRFGVIEVEENVFAEIAAADEAEAFPGNQFGDGTDPHQFTKISSFM